MVVFIFLLSSNTWGNLISTSTIRELNQRWAQVRRYQYNCSQLTLNARGSTSGSNIYAALADIGSAVELLHSSRIKIRSRDDQGNPLLASLIQAEQELSEAIDFLHRSCTRIVDFTRAIGTSESSIVEDIFGAPFRALEDGTRQDKVREFWPLVNAANNSQYPAIILRQVVQNTNETLSSNQISAPNPPESNCDGENQEGTNREDTPPTPLQQQVRDIMRAQRERSRQLRRERRQEERRRARRANTRTREEILQEVDRAIQNSQNGEIPQNFDFFLHKAELQARETRISQGEWEDAQQNWRNINLRVEEIIADQDIPEEDKLGHVIRLLNVELSGNYFRDSARELDALTPTGGNCVTVNNALLSILSRNPSLIPNGFQLGSASFRDHQEAVLIPRDRNDHRYHDLNANRIGNYRETDVWTPISTIITFRHNNSEAANPTEHRLVRFDPQALENQPPREIQEANAALLSRGVGAQAFPASPPIYSARSIIPERAQIALPPLYPTEVNSVLSPEDSEQRSEVAEQTSADEENTVDNYFIRISQHYHANHNLIQILNDTKNDYPNLNLNQLKVELQRRISIHFEMDLNNYRQNSRNGRSFMPDISMCEALEIDCSDLAVVAQAREIARQESLNFSQNPGQLAEMTDTFRRQQERRNQINCVENPTRCDRDPLLQRPSVSPALLDELVRFYPDETQDLAETISAPGQFGFDLQSSEVMNIILRSSQQSRSPNAARSSTLTNQRGQRGSNDSVNSALQDTSQSRYTLPPETLITIFLQRIKNEILSRGIEEVVNDSQLRQLFNRTLLAVSVVSMRTQRNSNIEVGEVEVNPNSDGGITINSGSATSTGIRMCDFEFDIDLSHSFHNLLMIDTEIRNYVQRICPN